MINATCKVIYLKIVSKQKELKIKASLKTTEKYVMKNTDSKTKLVSEENDHLSLSAEWKTVCAEQWLINLNTYQKKNINYLSMLELTIVFK